MASYNDSTSARAADWIADGQRWPEGRLRHGAPPWAVFGQVLAQNLRRCVGWSGLSLPDLAKRAGLERADVDAIVNGARPVSMYVIAQIEHVTGQRLWPSLEELDAARPGGE